MAADIAVSEYAALYNHSSQQQSQQILSKSHPNKPALECRYCRQIFYTNSQLTAHINISHSHLLDTNRFNINITNIKSVNLSQQTNAGTNYHCNTPPNPMDLSTLPSIDFNALLSSLPVFNEILPIKQELNTIATINLHNNHIHDHHNHNTAKSKHSSMQCRYCPLLFGKNEYLMRHLNANHLAQLNKMSHQDIQMDAQNEKKRKRAPIEPPKPPLPSPSNIPFNVHNGYNYKPMRKKRKRPNFNYNNEIYNGIYNPLQCRYCCRVFDANKVLMQHIHNVHFANYNKNIALIAEGSDSSGSSESDSAYSEYEPYNEKLIETYSDCESADVDGKKVKRRKLRKKRRKKKKMKVKELRMKGLRPSRWKKWDKKMDLMKCTYCTYKTNSSCHLRDHLLVHSGEKPFKCCKCNQKFRQKSHLKTHNKRYHKNKSNANVNDC